MSERTFELADLGRTTQPLAATERRTGTAARPAGDGQECPYYKNARKNTRDHPVKERPGLAPQTIASHRFAVGDVQRHRPDEGHPRNSWKSQ